MDRSYYSDSIELFCAADPAFVLGAMARRHGFDLVEEQRDAWLEQLTILRGALASFCGSIHLEFSIPRMGRRIDAVLLIDQVIFVLEFKVGERTFLSADLDQVMDYALDLQNFHEGSHNAIIAPILVATRAAPRLHVVWSKDKLLAPIKTDAKGLGAAITAVLNAGTGQCIDPQLWESSRYHPTPTIIEAALALYAGHSVAEISRSDAGAINLGRTSTTLNQIIESSRRESAKSICFVTGVPGAGKTLVGLNIATTHIDADDELYSVFLSGNGPLVAVLREALARDRLRRERDRGKKVRKGEALSEVKAFIQNVHHFRDDCLQSPTQPPIEHVAIFDEAQRAWNLEMTARFMRRKKGVEGFKVSEPEYLISCLDRHSDWAVVVCLVGGGQEINTGEAGIVEWITALQRSFRNWRIYVSDRLTDSEYGAGAVVDALRPDPRTRFEHDLHLATSVRSFRSERVSQFVKQLLDLDTAGAREVLQQIGDKYPIVLTRNLNRGRCWVREQARGSERYGILVSSQAERLKPYAVDVKSPVDPVHWFLDGKDDVRSSYYLEDVATEFHVQGLELDWACVAWDADFRYSDAGWEHWSFRSKQWQRMRQPDRQHYQKNAYRVLLTRARQGMVLVVPEGDRNDPTRDPEYYDATFHYLNTLGLPLIS
jgi:Uncharacterized conserved protein (DUF2075)